MSNPGVITLAEGLINNQSFKIEDNIGESIHVHYGNIRIEFSVHEFIQFVDAVIEIAEKLCGIDFYSCKRFDPIFLADLKDNLIKIKRIEYRNVKVSELLTINSNNEIIELTEGRAIKAYKGDYEELGKWRQTNYLFEDNRKRLERVTASIKNYGYDYQKGCIVVYNDGKIIVDGFHRASAIIDIYGRDKEITIAQFWTDGSLSDENTELYYSYERYKNRKEVNSNRRIADYLIDRDLKGKKLIIKGAGKHTVEFLRLGAGRFTVVGILAEEIREKELEKYKYLSPDEAKNSDADIIFLSSYRFVSEMYKDVMIYSDKYEIYDFYSNGLKGEFF